MKPSLFTPLLRPKEEDFLTEIFVGVLRRAPSVAALLIGHLTRSQIDTVWSVESQAAYGGDRPDIEVVADSPRGPVVVLVESKVGSSEGEDQLARYARLLDGICEERAAMGHLVYVTRNYDPKDADEVLADVDRTRCRFTQHRWNDVHRHVREQASGREISPVSRFLCEELAQYLEDSNMTLPRHLTPEMMVGLGHLPQLVKFLDHCLGEEVGATFNGMANKGRSTTPSMNTLRDYGQFVLAADISWAWFSVGFSLRGTSEPGWPDLFIDIGVNPKHPQYADYMGRVNDFIASNTEWMPVEPQPWAGLRATRSMREIVAEANQVVAIRGWFIARLAEVVPLVPAWAGE